MRAVLALLAVVSGASAAVVVMGEQSYDLDKMAAAINAKIDQCFTAEEGEETPVAYANDCGCALDEGEFCFQLQFTDPDYPEDGAQEDFRCAQLPSECQAAAEAAEESGTTAAPGESATSPAPASGGPLPKQPGDIDDLCCWWASCGECSVNPAYMKAQCAGSCAPGAVCTAAPPSENCKRSKEAYLQEQGGGAPVAAQADPGMMGPKPAGPAEPQGVIGSPSLPGNAQPPPMTPMMPGTNAGPSPAVPETQPMPEPMPAPQPMPQQSPPTAAGCSNDAPLCEFWNSIGECQANPAYMAKTCRKACQLC